MKKFMLGAALIAVGATMAAPSMAAENTRTTHEVTEVVGYVKTETTINTRDALFAETDKSGDGAINFREFANASMFENEYAMFNMNDTNNDDLLDIHEFRAFSKHGPARVDNSSSYKNSNFNKRPAY